MARWGWLASVLCAIAAHCLAAERTWTSADGRTMRAEFVRESGGEVTFLKDGQLITLPLARLSEKDQQNVRDLAAGKQLPEEPAAAASEPAGTQNAPPAAGEAPKPIEGKKEPANVNRVWTDKYGNQTTAKFVRMTGGNVVLVTRANKNIVLGFYELTSEDQDFLRDLLVAQGKETQIPPPPPVPVERPAENPAAAPSRPSFPQPSFPQPPVPGSGSSLLEEMRARSEQLRQEAQQRAEESRQRFEQMQQESQQRAAEARQKMQEDIDRRRQEAEAAAQNQIVGSCLSCKKPLTRSQTEQDTCPHCGVTWQFQVDSFGQKRRIYSPATADLSHGRPANAPPAVPKLDPQTVVKVRQFFVIGVVVVGVLGMLAVVVFVAITIAAASGAKGQRKYS